MHIFLFFSVGRRIDFQKSQTRRRAMKTTGESVCMLCHNKETKQLTVFQAEQISHL